MLESQYLSANISFSAAVVNRIEIHNILLFAKAELMLHLFGKNSMKMPENHSKSIIKFINFIVIIILFLIAMYYLRYPFISNLDMYDFFPYKVPFHHFRALNELIIAAFLRYFPVILNIHPQNFAIVSEAMLKVIFYVAFVVYISKSYNSFKQKPILVPVTMFVSFYTLYAILVQDECTTFLDHNEYYFGYVAPAIIVFLGFWYHFKNFYFEETNVSRRNYFILFVFLILTFMSNEELYLVSIFMILFTFIELLCEYFKDKNKILLIKIKYLSATIIFCALALVFILCVHNSVKELWNTFELSFNCFLTFDTVKKFTYTYFHYVIFNNLYITIPLIINIMLLHFNEIKYQKELKYIIYPLIGFSIFQIATITMPMTCYCTSEKYSFWYLHQGLLYCFRVYLLFILIYITGYTYSMLNCKEKLKQIPIIIFLISVLYFNLSVKYIPPTFFDKQYREKLYIAEKLSIFYIKQNKTAVLPNDVIPIEIVDYVNPWDMKYKPEIYTKTYVDSLYFEYLKLVYGVDAPNGMTFLPTDEALKIYKENGGKLTDEELEKLDFKNIEKQFD